MLHSKVCYVPGWGFRKVYERIQEVKQETCSETGVCKQVPCCLTCSETEVHLSHIDGETAIICWGVNARVDYAMKNKKRRYKDDGKPRLLNRDGSVEQSVSKYLRGGGEGAPS